MRTFALHSVVLTALFAVPAIARAASINELLGDIVSLMNDALIPLLLAIAFITFIYGVFKYFIAASANEEARQQGRVVVVYSLIGFFVLLSAWGILNLLAYQFVDVLPSPNEPTNVPFAPE
jgi:hypothetical protein